MAMTLVSTTTVPSGGAASIEFTNIPQTGKDLLLLLSANGGSGNQNISLQYNNITTQTYAWRRLRGDGATVASDNSTADFDIITLANPNANFSSYQATISNYTSSAAKSVSIDSVTEANATTAFQQLVAGSWTGTAAVTSLQIGADNGSFTQHTSASLYIIS